MESTNKQQLKQLAKQAGIIDKAKRLGLVGALLNSGWTGVAALLAAPMLVGALTGLAHGEHAANKKVLQYSPKVRSNLIQLQLANKMYDRLDALHRARQAKLRREQAPIAEPRGNNANVDDVGNMFG